VYPEYSSVAVETGGANPPNIKPAVAVPAPPSCLLAVLIFPEADQAFNLN
jgi:hypothetical protein